MYTHIIVPFDGEEPARRAAAVGADLSRLFDNRLVVVTATPPGDGADVRALKERAMALSEARVDVWIEPDDRPDDAIVTAVRHRPRSLVCMATHARQGLRRAVQGSITESVVARAEVPVVLVGPGFVPADRTAVRRLVICVDGSATAETVLPVAARWARHLDLPCVLVHVDTGASGPRRPDLPLLASLLEPSSPSVSIAEVRSRDVTGAIIEHLGAGSDALGVMATANMAPGRNTNRPASRVMRVVERAAVPVLVERAGARRPVAVAR